MCHVVGHDGPVPLDLPGVRDGIPPEIRGYPESVQPRLFFMRLSAELWEFSCILSKNTELFETNLMTCVQMMDRRVLRS